MKPHITLERLKELAHYDPATGQFVLKKHRKGTTRKIGDVLGSKTKKGYLEAGFDQRIYLLHRLAYFYMTGEVPEFIDHINGNGMDNRWDNLRSVTHQQNMENKKKMRPDNTTGYRGVHRWHGKYRAKIVVNKKQIHLGTFSTAEEAAKAYEAARPSIHSFYVPPEVIR
jgi:hypothetical protein